MNEFDFVPFTGAKKVYSLRKRLGLLLRRVDNDGVQTRHSYRCSVCRGIGHRAVKCEVRSRLADMFWEGRE